MSARPNLVQTLALTAIGVVALVAARSPAIAGAAVAIALVALAIEWWLRGALAPPAGSVSRPARLLFWLTIAAALAAYGLASLREDAHAGILAVAAVLLAACPRAVQALAPLAASAGIERTRGGGLGDACPDALARLRDVRTLVVDKAGLITANAPRLAQQLDREEGERERVLSLAAALERNVDHPLAQALAAAAPEGGATATDVVVHPSQGITGSVDGHHVVVGSPELLVSEGIDVRPLTEAFHFAVQSGQTAIGVAVDDEPCAVYTFTDEIRPGVAEALTALKRRGCYILVATGARERTLKMRLTTLWVHEVRGHLTSDKKIALLHSLEAENKLPLFVASVDSDRRVLESFPYTIAMGARNGDTHGAAIGLPDTDLRSLAALIDRARAPSRRVRPATRALCAYHAVALPLAGLGLLPPLAAAGAAALASLAALAWVRAS